MEIKKYATKLLPSWTKTVPFQIKGIAIRDAHNAFWAAKGKPKFRSRKATLQSCFIPRSAITSKGIYSRISGKGLIFKESLPDEVLDSRLTFQYNQWFLSVPSKITRRVAESQGHGIVALDPGVRTFQTFFSETSAGHIGHYDIGRITRLCYYLDDLISRTSKASKKCKKSMRLAQGRIRLRIKNLVKELHHKTAYFLVNNFDVILLPTFESAKMSSKTGKLYSRSARQLLTWSHYKFKMILKNKALEFGKTVIDVCEAYTSKTVSWTGELVNIGRSKVIRSNGIKLDRDLNGARNIFIRSLGDSPALINMIKSRAHC
jgi:putative transposase